MKNYIRILTIIIALTFGAVSGAWAQLTNDDIEIEINPDAAGTITKSVNATTREVTLTVTPASGYFIRTSDFAIEKLVSPESANARRRVGEVTDKITGKMYSGSGRTDEDVVSSVKHPNSAEFVFTLPAGYDGAYVTATFRLLTDDDVIRITADTSLGDNPSMSAHYILVEDVSASVVEKLYSNTAFTGIFEGEAQEDGNFPKITGLTHALFQTVNGGTVKNVILDNVSISGGTNVGAICNEATGASRIYNCGVLSGSIDGSNNVGGLVGLLNGTARVVNCFSYAAINSGTNKGGIVGSNGVSSTQASLTTMVMNCMFYGEISSGGSVSPIYGGTEINNVAGGLNNYNYYRYQSSYSKNKQITKYNRALAMEEKFITRFERYRLLLNSNKKLAAKYVSTATTTVDPSDMAKWVLETADKSISGRDPYPYPVLKAQGYYPSIINPDIANAPDSATVGRNKGGKLPSSRRVLYVTISSSKTSGGQSWPTGARVIRPALTLERTDKDTTLFNFNYDKVQLPYYNDIGTGNYTGRRVVTGWKITSITGGTPGTFKEADEWGGYNFADRKCTNKDLYSVSKRVFSQGAYWDVPEGVTAITIEPYWAIANYVSDATYDVVYDNAYTAKSFSPFGTQYENNSDIDIYGDGNKQKVYTSISSALAGFDNSNKTVYDQAVVLVGNVHQYADPTKTDNPYTVMSIDMNHDNEPDYSYIFSHDNRKPIDPIRYDFLNIMGIAEAQIPNGASLLRNVSIFNLKGWFEITNTCVVNFSQFEYQNSEVSQNPVAKSPAPLILLGGSFEQIASTQKTSNPASTLYIHVGSNVWFAKFGNGTHSDGTGFTPHRPISVTGGDYDEFYLSGTYQPDATVQSDNAECYISGGRFGEMAGASMEAIHGDVQWDINWADITNFYGGGVNAINPITGKIQIDITNSHVNQYCGGPKFGDMVEDKTVTTNATDCVFGTYFGAGYGGNAYKRLKYKDEADKEPKSQQGNYKDERGKYYDGTSNSTSYGKKGKGVATDFDYEFFIWSSGKTGSRFYVNFVTFSLATTRGVTSNLTKCKVTGNVYGGGSLGKVDGDVGTTLNDCEIIGNVFGGGYSATLPKIGVRNTPAFIAGKEPTKNMNIGMFEPGEINTTVEYEWKYIASMPTNGQSGMVTVDGKNYVYTDTDLSALGTVTGNVTLNIQGTTTVGGSVYGGGEESGVDGNTEVTVNGGFIGAEGRSSYGYRYGNVYGGGKGKIDNEGNLVVSSVADLDAGLVKGNTSVTINGTKETTKIVHNVYGGGAVGSVGTFTRDANGNPTACTSGGQATVTINGGQVGHNRKDSGMVNGSSRGWEGNPNGEGAFAFLNQLAWVNNGTVIIGDATTNDEDKGPAILGSVYGGGENGHNYSDGSVTINKGTIGNAASSAESYDCGNVYGAGCGTDTYTIGEDPTEHHNQKAGWVRGNTYITVNGGNVLRNVYGGGSMGSVGNDAEEVSGKTTITINGGTIGSAEDSDHGHVFGGPKGNLDETEFKVSAKSTSVNINAHPSDAAKNPIVWGSVFGGGEAGIVKGSVEVNMTGGTVKKDVYGGGALADTQTSNWDASNDTWAEGKSSASTTTTVRLTGGTILGEAYGGGLGEAGKPARVYGDVALTLNQGVAEDARGCAVSEVFGCNNINGTPMGKVQVHIYATQNKAKSQIGNTDGETPVADAKVKGTYDVLAVYGGGNMAAYEPADAFSADEATKAGATTNVTIDGCGLTSIQYVYGGGNAASTPSTKVTVNGTFEIEELFGGGNGKDSIVVNNVKLANPGANVGFKDYSAVESTYDTKEKRQSEAFVNTYVYGSGKASLNVYGGTIHRVFGGSNTKGNVRHTAVTLLDENSGCAFCVDEAYGGGKSAPMDAEAQLLLACIPGLQAVYGGAEAADIKGNVTLNITNGTFDRVFGGNNLSGTIGGSITVNVEEIGCKPVKIGELYAGGNQAGYSVNGYNDDSTPKESGPKLYEDPQVNVKSFTSIGEVFGGGYGAGATMVGNPTVNVNVANGRYYNDEVSVVGENAETSGHYPIPSHAKGKMGAINNVFGGGNAAKVIGSTTVNIANLEEVYVVKQVNVGDDVSSLYIRNNDGTYNAATGTAEEGVTYYEKKDVLGVDIRGNVYGGGNNAEVTGDAKVNIGRRVE